MYVYVYMCWVSCISKKHFYIWTNIYTYMCILYILYVYTEGCVSKRPDRAFKRTCTECFVLKDAHCFVSEVRSLHISFFKKKKLNCNSRSLHVQANTPSTPRRDHYQILHTATHCNTLQHTATHCNTLQHTVTHCNTLQHTAMLCNALQHKYATTSSTWPLSITTHCNALQRAASQRNTLQHTATYCKANISSTPRRDNHQKCERKGKKGNKKKSTPTTCYSCCLLRKIPFVTWYTYIHTHIPIYMYIYIYI